MLPLAIGDVVLGVLAGLVVVIVVLAVAGYVATVNRRKRTEAAFRERIAAANEGLAAAHAEDRGWTEEAIFAAARAAQAQALGGTPQDHERAAAREVHLVQVIDRPGTDEDEALCVVEGADGGRAEVRVGRRNGEWVPLPAS